MKQSTAVLWAACLGYGMVILDTSVLNVALPSIAAETGASGVEQRWIVDSYVLVMTALLLAGGGLIDRFGAKRVFHVGIALFAAASVVSALTSSPGVLIAARAFQGIGGALLIPATLTVVVTFFAEPQARGKAIAIIATVTASPQAFGPTLGGVLVETLGWRSIFLLNVPVAFATLLFARKMPAGTPHRRALDLPGVALIALALGALTYAVIDVTEEWTFSPRVAIALVVALVGFAAFVMVERRAQAPLLPTEVRRAPTVQLYVLAGTFMFVLFYGALFAANLYFQKVLDLDAVTAGALLLPAGVPVFVLPLVVSRVAKKSSPATLTTVGVIVSTIGAAVAYSSAWFSSPFAIAVSLAVVGIGFGIASPPHLHLATAVAPAGTTGVISALANAGRQAGYLLGVAAVGSAGSGNPGFLQATTVAVAGGVLALLALRAAEAGRRRAARAAAAVAVESGQVAP